MLYNVLIKNENYSYRFFQQINSYFTCISHSGCGSVQWSHATILHWHVMVTCSSRCLLCTVTWQFSLVQEKSLKSQDAKWICFTNKIYMPEFLKTGLAKIRTHSTTWELKTIKFVQRSMKSLYLTPGSKLMVPRSIPTSRSLKWRKF